jgi:hypothetical protein
MVEFVETRLDIAFDNPVGRSPFPSIFSQGRVATAIGSEPVTGVVKVRCVRAIVGDPQVALLPWYVLRLPVRLFPRLEGCVRWKLIKVPRAHFDASNTGIGTTLACRVASYPHD